MWTAKMEKNKQTNKKQTANNNDNYNNITVMSMDRAKDI